LTKGDPLNTTHIFGTWAVSRRHRKRRHSARRQRLAVHGAILAVAATFILRDITSGE